VYSIASSWLKLLSEEAFRVRLWVQVVQKSQNLFTHEPIEGRYPLEGSVVPCMSSPPSYEHCGSAQNRSGIFKKWCLSIV
jgi:hypothetical protein